MYIDQVTGDRLFCKTFGFANLLSSVSSSLSSTYKRFKYNYLSIFCVRVYALFSVFVTASVGLLSKFDIKVNSIASFVCVCVLLGANMQSASNGRAFDYSYLAGRQMRLTRNATQKIDR